MSVDFLALGRDVLAQQPFSVLLGTQLTAFAPGEVEMTLPLKPEFRQQAGFTHGGVISYLADNALTFAGGSALGIEVVTAGYTINYISPGQGERLIARASVVGKGSRQAVCRCDIFAVQDGAEYLCATALGTIVGRAPTPGPSPAGGRGANVE